MLPIRLPRRIGDPSIELPKENSMVANSRLTPRTPESVKDGNLDATRLQLSDDRVEVGR